MNEPIATEPPPTSSGAGIILLVISWLWVGVPLAWGILETLASSKPLWN